MRRILLSVIMALIGGNTVYSQSATEKIANAMNSSDWFALDSIYRTEPKDSIWDFLEVYSRCLIGNRLNKPHMSMPAFEELFAKHNDKLDPSLWTGAVAMYAMDLSRIGKNDAAYYVVNSAIENGSEMLDSNTVQGFRTLASQYSGLSKYHIYDIEWPSSPVATIPFSINHVGPKHKNSVLMMLDSSAINNSEVQITFDTGAGVNIISDSLATRYGLKPLDAKAAVTGVAEQQGHMAIADKLKIGDIVIRNVPFYVIDITTRHQEADKYVDAFEVVVGSELMLRLKDLTIDFIDKKITIPTVSPIPTGEPSNICFSPAMNLQTRGKLMGDPMLMNIDSGDASFGYASSRFFERHRDYIISHAEADTIRQAGIGGTFSFLGYNLKDISVTLGGHTLAVPDFTIKSEDTSHSAPIDYEANIGLKTLMTFGRVRFNMVDFVFTTYPAMETPPKFPLMKTPAMSFQYKPEMKPWQTIGFAALAIARAVMFPSAADQVDL